MYSRQDADRLFRKLVIDGILFEELKITAMDTTACYIKLGRKANDVLNGKMKVCIPEISRIIVPSHVIVHPLILI